MTTETWFDVRWQCPNCGRFVAQERIGEVDHVDPGAYYGISTEMWVDCPRCGRVEWPRLVPVGEHPMVVEDGES